MSTALMFVLCAVAIDESNELIAHWIFCTGAIALCAIDVHTLRLPRRIIHVTALTSVPFLVVSASITGDEHRFVDAAYGASLALVAMLILFFLSSGKLGDGDVRLSALLGLYLGWHDLESVPTGLFLAFCLGASVGVVLMIVGRRHRSTAIPFGPFLFVGTLVTILFDFDVFI